MVQSIANPSARPVRSRRKAPRSVDWVPHSWCPEGGFGILRLQQGTEVDHYFLRMIPCDFGHGFELLKLDRACNTTYHIALDLTAERYSCECKGFLRWAHCKHVEGLLAMIAAGRFGAPAASAKGGAA